MTKYLPYVLNHLLRFTVALWMDPPLRHSDCCPFNNVPSVNSKHLREIIGPKALKEFGLPLEGGLTGYGPSTSSLFLAFWARFQESELQQLNWSLFCIN